ncbi:MAG TPA: endonuclease VII domain-containing protein [Methylomirabilota bacterium]|nr:endonuclease VII domain-containing protein [Methylomirabilota bacterium]
MSSKLAPHADLWYNTSTIQYVAQALRSTILSAIEERSVSPMEDIIPLWSKRCTKCDEEKNLSLFYKGDSWCKLCKFTYNRKKPTKSRKLIAEENVKTGIKTCANCNKTLLLEQDFYRKITSRDGRDSWCKHCRSVHDRKMLENRAASGKKNPLPSLGSKKCAQCGEEKPYSAFHRQKDHYYSWCRLCCSARKKELFVPHKAHGARLRRYQLTEEEYNTMLESQHGVCACCGNEETSFDKRTNAFRKLAVDHDHTTGQVRALLCTGCNTSLGALKESPERIQALLNYTLKYKGE